jgi:hypothetical protein
MHLDNVNTYVFNVKKGLKAYVIKSSILQPKPAKA